MPNRSMISVTLENPFAGTVLFLSPETPETFSINWVLEADGLPLSSGKFPLVLEKGRAKTVPLFRDIPPVLPGGIPMLRITVENSRLERESFSFPLPVTALEIPSAFETPSAVEFRADAASAFFSTGNLSGRLEAAGLQDLTGNGMPLLSRPPRFHALPQSWSPDELCLLKVIPDRFDTGRDLVRAHALVLPRGNEEDELEMTQTFMPLPDGIAVMQWHFIVPRSFAPLGDLGVSMELPAAFPELSALEKTPNGGAKTVIPETGDVKNAVSFLAFRAPGAGAGGLIVPASTMKISLAPGESGGRRLFCGVDTLDPLPCGCYRLQLFFKMIAPGESASGAARLIHS